MHYAIIFVAQFPLVMSKNYLFIIVVKYKPILTISNVVVSNVVKGVAKCMRRNMSV